MSIAVFGSKVFEVSSKIYTINELQYGSTLDTEKQESIGKKPSTYNKGPGLNSLAFKISLKSSLGVDSRTEIEEWEAIKDGGVAYPFILGNRPLGKNKWLLIDVQATDLVIDGNGNMLAAEINLKFDEYVRPGSVEQSASNKAPGVKKSTIDINNLVSNDEKAELKRENNVILSALR